jgi:hypothetical protein
LSVGAKRRTPLLSILAPSDFSSLSNPHPHFLITLALAKVITIVWLLNGYE